jgi:chromosome segregation ATPase
LKAEESLSQLLSLLSITDNLCRNYQISNKHRPSALQTGDNSVSTQIQRNLADLESHVMKFSSELKDESSQHSQMAAILNEINLLLGSSESKSSVSKLKDLKTAETQLSSELIQAKSRAKTLTEALRASQATLKNKNEEIDRLVG